MARWRWWRKVIGRNARLASSDMWVDLLAEMDRAWAMRPGEDLDRFEAELVAAGGARLSIEQALTADGVFVAHVFGAGQDGVLVLDAL